MNNKSSILTLIVVAIIAIGSSILFKPTVNVGVNPTPVTVNVPEQKTPIVNVNPQVRSPDVKVNVPESPRVLGSVVGPDSYFAYTANNDVRTYESRTKMRTATSTPCAYYVIATSTLNSFTVNVSSSTSVTSTRYTLATSTTAYATTSKITNFGTLVTNIAASAQAALVWHNNGDQLGVVSPGTYIVLGVQGGLGTFGTAAQVGGYCQVSYQEL